MVDFPNRFSRHHGSPSIGTHGIHFVVKGSPIQKGQFVQTVAGSSICPVKIPVPVETQASSSPFRRRFQANASLFDPALRQVFQGQLGFDDSFTVQAFSLSRTFFKSPIPRTGSRGRNLAVNFLLVMQFGVVRVMISLKSRADRKRWSPSSWFCSKRMSSSLSKTMKIVW